MAKGRGTVGAAQPQLVALDPTAPPPITEAQAEIKNATEGTSTAEAGGVEKVDESEIRMEAEGVKTALKADFDNPESPNVADSTLPLVGPKDPAPVTVGVGETPAMHEAHVLLGSPQQIAERIRREAEEGLPTDEIARQQQADAGNVEFQRIDALARRGNVVRDSERPKRGGAGVSGGETTQEDIDKAKRVHAGAGAGEKK